MASTYSKDLQIYSAEQFKRSVSQSNVYLTFGVVSPWVNDSNPPQANSSPASYYDSWKTMLGGKKINGNDIRHVIPRYDWTSNTVYAAYDNMMDLKNSANIRFYVMTTDFNVYKCIANNNGEPSTYKPTSTNPTSVFQTADQYIWKYMYTLSNEEQLRFTTSQFIPVRTLIADDNSLQWQVQEDAVPGSISSVIVTNQGNGYVSDHNIITITGDGIFANAYAVRNVITSSIESFIVDNPGSGYTYANVSITSTRGSGAAGRVIISPPGGHGSDALSELGGSYLMINPQLNGSEGGILLTGNDYRQICIIADPYVYQSTNVASNLAFSQVTVLSLGTGGTANYIQDEVVYQGTDIANATYKATVAYWDSANSLLSLTTVSGVPTSQLIIGYTSTASKYVSSVKEPDLQIYSGHILYKDNIVPITRAEDQLEDFKIVLSF